MRPLVTTAIALAVVGCRPSGSNERQAPPAAPSAPATTEPAATAGAFAFPLSPASPTALRAVPAFETATFDRPVFLTAAPSDPDHVYVVEQAGRVRRISTRPDEAEDTVVLDIRDRVRMEHNEEGLLGLAFSPDYARQRDVYLYYSASRPRRTQVSRMIARADGRIEPASERVLLTIEQPYGNHNGGMIAFGPDGMLYVGVGDGGAADDPHLHGQNLSTLLATILRLKVGPSIATYEIPTDNPFVDTAGARPEIWAYGLRNPWRFSFDRGSGQLWVGDVGQDRLEEIDLVTRGGNYGWNAREGTQAFRARTPAVDPLPPVTEYGRDEGESITGGYVYRGTKLADFRGMYLFGDYVTGRIWAIDPSADDPSARTHVATVPALSSFGEDAQGELYALSLHGTVYRFEASDPSVGERTFPTKLSQTGLFADLATLAPASGLLPYSVAVPFWSDGADKRRWVALPEGGRIEASNDGPWAFPVGTITVKHFDLPLDDGEPDKVRRLETRVMVHERGGWAGYSYRWNDAQTEADLVTAPTEASYEVVRAGKAKAWAWSYPAGSDCLRCHTPGYGQVLGIRTRQIASDATLLAALVERGHLASAPAAISHPALDDDTAPSKARARAYLDVNCARATTPADRHRAAWTCACRPARPR